MGHRKVIECLFCAHCVTLETLHWSQECFTVFPMVLWRLCKVYLVNQEWNHVKQKKPIIAMGNNGKFYIYSADRLWPCMKEQGCEYKWVPSAGCSGRWASPLEIRVRSSVIVPPGEVFQTLPNWEEVRGQTQDTLERLPTGLGMPRRFPLEEPV